MGTLLSVYENVKNRPQELETKAQTIQDEFGRLLEEQFNTTDKLNRIFEENDKQVLKELIRRITNKQSIDSMVKVDLQLKDTSVLNENILT